VDGVGNITQITDGSTPRTYSYIDNLYFLKQGDGPWGTRRWTYDRIGNRLTETRGTTTDIYSYTSHNPRLNSITMGGGAGTKDFSYDSNGNEIRLATPLLLLFQRYDGANRLFNIKDDATGAATYLTYDGRDFLTQARQDITTCCSPVLTQSVYSSEGVLQGRSVRSILGGTLTKDTKVLYFAGRPVGLLEMTTTPATLSYLNVDHLGTPILETTSAGASLWSGGFEPFGKDWNGAQAAGEFLRFPGQWEDAAWAGSEIYYNVRRWYEMNAARYSQPDPLKIASIKKYFQSPRLLSTESFSFFAYVDANPLAFVDPLGLAKFVGCSREQEQKVTEGLAEYCPKLDSPSFGGCCGRRSIAQGVKRLCSDPNLVVKCEASAEGKCAATLTDQGKLVTCGWSLPFGGVVHFCPSGWTSACGPVGCTLLHEMTHMSGHPFEAWPVAVERCLGCP
jgi:RHS repeat-associated protein